LLYLRADCKEAAKRGETQLAKLNAHETEIPKSLNKMQRMFCKFHTDIIHYAFYICGSVHHQSILLNNQRNAALSSCSEE